MVQTVRRRIQPRDLSPTLLALVLAMGCAEDGGDDTGADGGTDSAAETDDGMMGPVSFETSIEPILTAGCVEGCHEIDGLNENLILSAPNTYDALVDVMSGQLPQMKYVNPGDKSTSYMWHKLNNTHIDEGGIGAQMPYQNMQLPAADLILIGDWIDEGAMP